MRKEITFYAIIGILAYFVISQVDVFKLLPSFPFLDLKFKHKEIVEDKSKIKSAEKEIAVLKQQELIHKREFSHLQDENDSLRKSIAAIDSRTDEQIGHLEQSFLEDSLNTILEYRKALSGFYPSISYVKTPPLSYREIGLGSIVFRRYAGCLGGLKIRDDIISNRDSAIVQLVHIVMIKDSIEKKDSVIIGSLGNQVEDLHYPYTMSLEAGIRSILFDSGFYTGLFGRYTVKAINTERFEVYVSGEASYFPEKGFSPAAETGIKIKFGE